MATLSERPDIDWLRRSARALQRGVRTGDPDALRRAAITFPDSDFRLSDAQRVIARERGFASWPRLQSHVRAIAGRTWLPTPAAPDETPADRFVRAVCETWTGTPPDLHAARALLDAHPDITGNPVVATVLGDPWTVHRALGGGEANAPCGPFGWSLLMYLAFSRWPVAEVDAVATARSLLDHGADPDDGRHFVGHATPFTVLTGLFGGGENNESRHPHQEALAHVILRAGAAPTDAQLLYNRMFGDDDAHLRLLFSFGLGSGRGGPWRRRLPDLVPSPDELVRQQLGWAIVRGLRARVRLLADHGVDVLTPLPEGPGPLRPGGTPLAVALRNGHPEIADDLRERGAVEPDLDDVEVLVGAVLDGDLSTVRSSDPDVLAQARRRHPGLTAWAATRGVPAVEAAITAGFAIDALGRGDAPIDQPWQTALHTAVERDHPELVVWLVEHGADTTVRDARFDATPLDWARHLGHPRCEAALVSVESESD